MKMIKPLTVSANCLNSGEPLTLPKNTIKTGKHLSFYAQIPRLGGGKIVVGHGYMTYNGSWIEITENEIQAYNYYSYTNPKLQPILREPFAHGLELDKFISVNISVDSTGKGYFATVMSANGSVKVGLGGWTGSDGEIVALADGIEMKNAKLNWFTDSFAKKIWIVGDSYLGYGHAARWPYYLYRDGYANALLTGYAGMSATRGIEEFREIIKMGEPEYAVWCLGMNNADSETEISSSYLEATEEFLAICKERGITAILSTVPNVPNRENSHKNDYVRASGYRYIDFAKAVGGEERGSSWYPDMLFTDLVHPAALGAEALYMRVLVDFPEIMQE